MKKILFISIFVLLIACTESRRHAKTDIVIMDSLAAIIPKSDTITLINKQIIEFLDDKRLDIKINYPQMIYYPIAESMQMFNSIMKYHVENTKNLFMMEIPTIEEWPEEFKEFKNEFTIEYQVLNNSESLASVLYEVFQYGVGSIHGLHYNISLNVDLQRGELISDYDLFADSLFLIKVSDLTRLELLKKVDSDTAWVTSGTQPVIENFRNFNLAKDSLIITFDPYQVGPFCDGSVRVALSYKKLDATLPNRILNKEFR